MMGLTAKWDITYKCNLNCGHCINGDFLNKIEHELSLNEIKKVIDNLKATEIDYIHLLGGEPTFRKDFIEICKYFEEKNIRFGFNTNGLNIAKDNISPVIFNKSLKNIVFSLEGPTAEINDKIRGKNVFEIVCKNIKSIVKFKKENNLNHFYTTVNTVISKDNYDYIIDMIDLCIDLGIDQINLLELIVSGNAKGKDLEITDEQELLLVNKLANKYASVKDKIEIVPKFTLPIVSDYCKEILNLEYPKFSHGCGAGTNFAYINNKGELYPCDLYRDFMKDEETSLVENKYTNVWSKEKFNDIFTLTHSNYYNKYKPCNKCNHLKKDCFPCPISGLNDKVHKVNKCVKYANLLNWGDQIAK